MASTFTDLGIELMATGENAGTWGTKTNANLSLIEQLTGGVLSLAIAGSGTTALTIADGALTGTAQQRVIELTGSISGNRIIAFPLLTENFYIVKNGTSGAYTVQLKAASGSGATVTFSATDKGYKLIYLDGVATNTGLFEATIGTGDVTLTGTQTLTNKTLTDPIIANILSVSNGDVNIAPNGTGHLTVKGNTNAGIIQLNCESNSHGQQIKSQPHSTNTTNVMLLPEGADSTLLSRVSIDTLTNKTLTSPKINENVAVTSTSSELNILDGVTSTAAELNLVDGSSAGTIVNSKAVIYSSGGQVNGTSLAIAGTAVTSTAAELNFSDLATLGTTAASKVFTANANNLTTISGAVLNTEDALTDASTITWNVINSPVAKVTLTANRTMAAPSGTGAAAGQFVSILVIQDAGGTNTLAWNAVYEFTGDVAPTLTSTGAKGDIFSFRYNGSKWLEIGRNLNLTLS